MQLTSLIGRKTYQKQGFLQDGTRVPLSGIVVAGNFVTQVKSADKEGYNALQLGIGINKKAKKTAVNHSKKAGLTQTPRFLKEVRVDEVAGAISGTEIIVSDIFVPGDIVDVTGISKGKGFAGGVKRWGFKGGPRTHGQSDRERAPGSIGQTTTPGRVYKGKKMAGRMGQDTVTVKNLEIIEITADGVLLIKGLVPGSINSIVVVKKMGTNKKFVPMYKEIVDEPDEQSEVPGGIVETAVEAGDVAGDSQSSTSDDAKPEEVGSSQSHVASDVQPVQSKAEVIELAVEEPVQSEEKPTEPASVETTAGKGEDK